MFCACQLYSVQFFSFLFFTVPLPYVILGIPKITVRDSLFGVPRGINNEGDYEHVIVQGERVDDVVKEDVALIKFDVEGFEPTAFASAARLFDNFKCATKPDPNLKLEVKGFEPTTSCIMLAIIVMISASNTNNLICCL